MKTVEMIARYLLGLAMLIFGFTLYNMGFDKLPNPPKAKIKS